MTDRSGLLTRPVVPVSDADDAVETYDALRPEIDPDCCQPLVVSVVAASGADDTPQRAATNRATDAVDRFASLAAADGIAVDTDVLTGDDIAASIIDAATAAGASAIAFHSRGGSDWLDVVAGGVRTALIVKSDCPVVVLPADER
ncbi:universal stress protein [Halonotius sp. F2-221B]|uniref:universal stress protein n=1 Tax=Halonotius sp. F2-221B TaxID=2731620 RepID=UPI00398B931D